MPTRKVKFTTQVVKTPSSEELRIQQQKVDLLRNQLQTSWNSPRQEHFRNEWAKQRALLSQMQSRFYQSSRRKEVNHV